ncbi:pyridoxal phosphate-dependent aminotransferase [Flavobacteriaceae bacterium]|nr:pyridoxal phosphate-dependent aminotransferase [Flavobacteriaceae bacterium]MDA9319189.1 pyridoxal phosphate-dependent aminotransferase [Flavobacteriaceae bacterium]MDA9330327.1 pyridoxal phosphate-dependent aminotransferase [bacterium]MDB4092741.1 pyridoxal phosphate-dependent aminotransferase [Flavobacteriaceae bacterium]MDB9849252.1 pyridoxal phosphate-dependent aminotransferase [Flavobacteriaceae bacterium]
MINKLSKRINNLPVSATLAMAAKARELKENGIDIIGLSLGEPDFNTPDFIKNAAIKAIEDNYNSYTPVDGYVDLKKSICKKFKRDNDLEYKLDQIVVSTGAKQSIANTVQVLVNPGDDVLLVAPYWVSYSAIVTLAEGNPIEIRSDISSDFKITPVQLENSITSKTKLVIINSPNNPSGSVYSEKEYKALAKVLEKYPDIFILSDEIYEHINYGIPHFSFAKIPSMYERTITINGLAKAFAMTGWRVGYIGAPNWIAKACTKMQGQITSGTNCIAQRACIAALEAPVSEIKYMIDEFKSRRELIIKLLKDIKGFKLNEPKGAFYVFPDISSFFGKTLKNKKINNASDFAIYLLEKAHVATVTGEAFGSPNNIRISYAASTENIENAIQRIKNAVENQ